MLLRLNLWQNDMIQWLIDGAPEDYRTVDLMANRLLLINFAALHTTSMVSGLYYACARTLSRS